MLETLKNRLKQLQIYQVIRRTGLFDRECYLQNNLDVARSCTDPIRHYIRYGWREGRKPSHSSDTNEYLRKIIEARNLDLYSSSSDLKARQFEFSGSHSFDDYQDDLHCEKSNKKHECLIESNGKLRVTNVSQEKDCYVEYNPPRESDSIIKAIAFYLPQFHPIKENNEWWGHGFTEWSNTTKARPVFEGHYQPRLPTHFGFYDLRLDEIMIEQARIAKEYAIHGFCYHYYWFNGKRLLEKPIESMLENPKIDIPFCLCWANENWSRRWDGSEKEILISQKHSEDDFTLQIKDLLRYFKDERYIKINNKPLMLVYRANIIPKIKKMVEVWRKHVKDAGFDDIYLVACQTFGLKDPRPYYFDAAIEFPPHTVTSGQISKKMLQNNFTGKLYSYEEVVLNESRKTKEDFKCFRTAMLSWDNTARMQNDSHIFCDFSIGKYKDWLSVACDDVLYDKRFCIDEKFVFINAWNEWAEGTHLEPDRKYGFSYLNATHSVLNRYTKSIANCLKNESPITQKSNYAVIFHLYHADLFDLYSDYIDNIPFSYDLFISLNPEMTKEDIQRIQKRCPSANLFMFPNKGRDMYPFVKILKKIGRNYTAICKIHTKKTSYRKDTNKIRCELLNSLLGSPAQIRKILDILSQNCMGVVGPRKYLLEHDAQNMYYNEKNCKLLAEKAGIRYEHYKFFAGSMFWFNPKALKGIEGIPENEFSFENEYADGTIAHAIERMILLYAKKNGFKFECV